MPVLLSIGVFLTVFFITIGIYNLVFSPRVDTITRLKKYTAEEEAYTGILEGEKGTDNEKIFKVLGIFGRIMPKSNYVDKKKKKLMQAAVLMKPEEFLGTSLISAIGIGGIFLLITKSIALSFLMLILGFMIPDVIVGIKKSKRTAKINSQLPESLNIISNGLRAGFSFIQSIGVVVSEVGGPIGEEFSKVLRDNVLGKPLEEALTNMSERTDDEDLDMVITTLIIQRQVGGNLAEVLDSIANTIRERVKIKNDVKTLTAQGRLSGIIISLLPFAMALALSVISPGYLNVLFTTFIGKVMVSVGLILQVIGIFVLTKLVDIKV